MRDRAAAREAACGEIARALLRGGGRPTRDRARAEAAAACSRHGLDSIPTNAQILAAAAGAPPEGLAALRGALAKRPVKTASGVAVVAVMPMPYACPHGRCTYCPGGEAQNTPNSYTGGEPAAAAAARNGFDARLQVEERLAALSACGHDTTKAEIVVVGGTFLFMPPAYRELFVKSCYEALNGRRSGTLREAQEANESAPRRCVGLTIETKPDYCRRGHVDAMLLYGATRVEIGVQSLREEVYARVNRGHTYADVAESFRVSRDAGYKVAAHMMPGLPGSTPEGDAADFDRLWSDPGLRPDMLKVYPALVVRGTPLHRMHEKGEYEPYGEEEAVRLLCRVKSRVPRWVRIMRVQREIAPSEIAAGPSSGNLRQLVLERMASEGLSCSCIRCREAGLRGGGRPPAPPGSLRLDRADYAASGGREAFISLVDGDGSVHGFARLRRPGAGAHRPEVARGRPCCIIRELHVYGRAAGIGGGGGEIQHRGLGRRLVAEAEAAAAGEMGARRMLVISAVGTRGYYARLGYRRDGPYMARDLPGR